MSLFLTHAISNAQVSVSVNIGIQPDWGPVGFDYVEYYYIPQYEVYYYVPKHQFIYLEGSRWIFATALPPRFGTIDLYSPYKVVINEPKPWLHFKEHQAKYATYKGGGQKQEAIRDSKDPKYVEARNKNKSNQKNVKEQAAPKEKAAPKKDQPNASPAHDSKEKQKPKAKKDDKGKPHNE
jgi:hypothetical protein